MTEREALLAALRDPAPPVAGWWPPAPGWWAVLALLALTALALAALRRWRRRTARRGRERWTREARAALAALRARNAAGESAAVLADASVLARRALLAVRPRREVAALHGERWLAALDEAGGVPAFTGGAGRLLESAPYRREVSVPREEVGALLDAIERIVRRAEGDARESRPPGAVRPEGRGR